MATHHYSMQPWPAAAALKRTIYRRPAKGAREASINKAVRAVNVAQYFLAEMMRDLEQHAVSARIRYPLVSARMSGDTFAAKGPERMYAVLDCIDFNDGWIEVQIEGSPAFKYRCLALQECMIKRKDEPHMPPHNSVKAAGMTASIALRHVYEARRSLEWHSSQLTLKGPETRGVGVVARSTTAKGLLVAALSVAKQMALRCRAVDGVTAARVKFEREKY